MISRYTLPDMAAIWSDEHRYSTWLEVELLALEGMEQEGVVPAGVAAAVRSKAISNPARADELERELKHDVIAFLTSVAEVAGPDARFLHRGMTSSDLIDTAFAVQLGEAGDLIQNMCEKVLVALRELALAHKFTICIGRSHGIHAEPTTFGLKVLSWYAELQRWLCSFSGAIRDIRTGKIAGAVGTYHSVSPAVEQYVLSRLGLQPESVPSQIVHRDRHARFFNELALLGASVERIAVELRHLQRTEVREVEEGFSKGQKGSSAMPHKKNPISAENITGLARLLRGYAHATIENVPLWHERDISHSSVERVVAPDSCIVAHYMLHRLHGLITGLQVFPERMQSNLELLRGTIFSGSVLIALTDAGISREEAYRIVQRHAHDAIHEGSAARSFHERILSDDTALQALGRERIDEIFDVQRHTRAVEVIFGRVLMSAGTIV
jgi:adenylosuccinate lyase